MRGQMKHLALLSAGIMLSEGLINNQQHTKLVNQAETPIRYGGPIYMPTRSQRIKSKRLSKRK